MRNGTVGTMEMPGPVTVEVDHGIQYLVVRCACCNEVKRNRIVPGRSTSPDLFLASVRRAGWEADEKRREAYCPEHTASKRRKAQRAALLATVVKDEPSSQEPLVSTTTTAPVVPKPLTTDQRVRIRGLLDKHFDDKAGRYLDNMSDQAIADAVAVPRAHVTTMREAAYGPLRVTAEMEDLAKANEALARAVAALQRQVEQVQSNVTELAAKLSALSADAATHGIRVYRVLSGK